MNNPTPQSWDDLGMNWDDPDITNPVYLHAVLLALIERMAALRDLGLFNSAYPHIELYYRPFSINTLDVIRNGIFQIAHRFHNPDSVYIQDNGNSQYLYYENYTYRGLVDEFPLYDSPPVGSMPNHENFKTFLMAAKAILDKLTTVIQTDRDYYAKKVIIKYFSSSAGDYSKAGAFQKIKDHLNEQGPYVSEYSDTILDILPNFYNYTRLNRSYFPYDSFYDFGVEVNNRAWDVVLDGGKNVPKSGIVFDLLFLFNAVRAGIRYSWNSNIYQSIFNAGGNDITEGVNIINLGSIKDDIHFVFGDVMELNEDIPIPPQPDEDRMNIVIQGFTLASTGVPGGLVAGCGFLHDYAVEGGFQFRP